MDLIAGKVSEVLALGEGHVVTFRTNAVADAQAKVPDK
jgi:hypothetical protein